MDRVYELCYINIVAAHAENVKGGCFEWSEYLYTSCVVELSEQLFLLENELHINSRAWVLQSRLLSRRASSVRNCPRRGKYLEGDIPLLGVESPVALALPR